MRSIAAAALLLPPLIWIGSCTALEGGADVFETAAAAGQPGGAGASNAGGSGNNSGAPQQGEAGAGGGELPVAGAGSNEGGQGSVGCPPGEERSVEQLAESGELTISSDTAWTCQRDYQLNGNVIIAPGATLVIMPGTRVLMGKKVLLLSQRGAQLKAEGTVEQPITFTSAAEPGARAPGDYRGVILIGDGPSHSTTVPVYDSLNDSRAHFGGGQAGKSNGSCGTLRYVRIEFAGGGIDDQSLPAAALTLAGCGSTTVVDYVQVHRALDGVGILGGTVPLRHVLVTNNLLGQAIEWTGGYAGTMQFIVAQSLAASAAMQGSNSVEDAEAAPVSHPTIYNATLVGSPPIVTGQHHGLLLQFGSRATFKNSLIQGFSDAAFDLRLSDGVLANEVGAGKSIDISHVLLHGNVSDFSQTAAVLAGMESMRTQDPGLESAAHPTPDLPGAIPMFAPTSPTVNTQPAPVPGGFDATAGFRGGVPQDGVDWTLGWTSYPSD